MTELFSFDNAVLRLTEQADQHSFAFFPTISSGDIVGGTIFLLLVDHNEDAPHLALFTESGVFGISVGEETSHHLDSLKQEENEITALYGIDPRTLRYKACDRQQISKSMMTLPEHAVAVLNGAPNLTPDSVNQASPIWSGWLTQHLPETVSSAVASVA